MCKRNEELEYVTGDLINRIKYLNEQLGYQISSFQNSSLYFKGIEQLLVNHTEMSQNLFPELKINNKEICDDISQKLEIVSLSSQKDSLYYVIYSQRKFIQSLLSNSNRDCQDDEKILKELERIENEYMEKINDLSSEKEIEIINSNNPNNINILKRIKNLEKEVSYYRNLCMNEISYAPKQEINTKSEILQLSDLINKLEGQKPQLKSFSDQYRLLFTSYVKQRDNQFTTIYDEFKQDIQQLKETMANPEERSDTADLVTMYIGEINSTFQQLQEEIRECNRTIDENYNAQYDRLNNINLSYADEIKTKENDIEKLKNINKLYKKTVISKNQEKFKRKLSNMEIEYKDKLQKANEYIDLLKENENKRDCTNENENSENVIQLKKVISHFKCNQIRYEQLFLLVQEELNELRQLNEMKNSNQIKQKSDLNILISQLTNISNYLNNSIIGVSLQLDPLPASNLYEEYQKTILENDNIDINNIIGRNISYN